jgi:hypothetical protein
VLHCTNTWAKGLGVYTVTGKGSRVDSQPGKGLGVYTVR